MARLTLFSAKVTGNHAAITVFGAAAPGVALFGAFWSWVGFEMAPNYGEESRRPKQIFSRATFGTLLALGAVLAVILLGVILFAVQAWRSGKTSGDFPPERSKKARRS